LAGAVLRRRVFQTGRAGLESRPPRARAPADILASAPPTDNAPSEERRSERNLPRYTPSDALHPKTARPASPPRRRRRIHSVLLILQEKSHRGGAISPQISSIPPRLLLTLFLTIFTIHLRRLAFTTTGTKEAGEMDAHDGRIFSIARALTA